MKWAEMTTRERDALVAENVMGFTVSIAEEYSQFHYQLAKKAKIPKSQMNIPKVINYYVNGKNVLRYYTTDISAAWQVVEKMKESHWFEARAGKLAESALFGAYTSKREYIAQQNTLPEAICLAALRAVGVDVE